MTGRERMNAVMHRQPVDRLAWATLEDGNQAYEWRTARGTLTGIYHANGHPLDGKATEIIMGV